MPQSKIRVTGMTLKQPELLVPKNKHSNYSHIFVSKQLENVPLWPSSLSTVAMPA
jgi:hypothetical protein